ncbi:MAG TPA: hypothetical protein VF486_10450 [Actinomycetes bacterium]
MRRMRPGPWYSGTIQAERCPVARTIGGCADLTTSVELTTG